ncbi:MAG: CDP-diacylglycerol--glycerol-3-phosphate 3-phosphatidyltransferase [Oscillospiraceae bacterium]|jgi:CDP-diacylglycerol--glycerol-3-phosphate 3-phosphatidyltransferase|nr:CDP-diacylglycerol--glycerol-3-phosphate 3-phosphatidyltransferase [Oscillospiraceae bacterium]
MKLPNLLTLTRVALAPVYLLLLHISGQAWRDYGEVNLPATLAAEAVLLAAIVSDALDGYFARKLNQTSDLGIFLDPIADKLLVLPPMLWMMGMARIPAWPVIIIITRELIVSALRLLAASKGTALAAGFTGKAKTVSEYALLAYYTLRGSAYAGDKPVLPWVCAALAVISAAEYFYKNRAMLAALFAPDGKVLSDGR